MICFKQGHLSIMQKNQLLSLYHKMHHINSPSMQLTTAPNVLIPITSNFYNKPNKTIESHSTAN